MSKQLTKSADKSSDQSLQTASWVRTIRETVESVVIAFILAFMFRTFEAEAFVIPTGSMAPTLQGRHKDIVCPECGYEFRTGASEEVERESNAVKDNCNMRTATCLMCRYRVVVDPNDAQSQGSFPSYNGDRIIVNKFAYDVSDPQRWDVVVFKYPEKSTENYIKRLVGLPNERVWLHDGDVFVAPLNSNDFHIARKPPAKVNETLQPVYDNDYVVPKLIKAGMPSRWQPWASEGAPSPWKMSDDYKSFSADNSENQTAWLRYQHLLPSEAIWNAVQAGRQVQSPLPSLIHDFYAYNDGKFPPGCDYPSSPTAVWVGDLAIDFTANVKSSSGALTLELVKGGRQFQCQINLADGRAKLSISGKPDFQPSGNTPLHSAGKYDLRFANVDQQLLLWVNGTLIEFDAPTTYDDLKNNQAIDVQPVAGSTQATDLSPVGIGIAGGSVEVSHLNIRRDVYYLSRSDPAYANTRIRSSIDLDHDQFFMLGDNSPKSSDGRYWPTQNYVDRRLLIGKALFVYWPHSFNYVEVGDKKIPIPYWPNFGPYAVRALRINKRSRDRSRRTLECRFCRLPDW